MNFARSLKRMDDFELKAQYNIANLIGAISLRKHGIINQGIRAKIASIAEELGNRRLDPIEAVAGIDNFYHEDDNEAIFIVLRGKDTEKTLVNEGNFRGTGKHVKYFNIDDAISRAKSYCRDDKSYYVAKVIRKVETERPTIKVTEIK